MSPWSSAWWLFCPLKPLGVEQAHSTHNTRTGTDVLQAVLVVSCTHLSTTKSQLTPETRESHILHNTLLINTVWLHSSSRWVTLDWSFTDHTSTFPVFPILWKDLPKFQHYLRMAQFSLIVYFWYLTDWHIKTWKRKTRYASPNWNNYFIDCILGHHTCCCIFS